MAYEYKVNIGGTDYEMSDIKSVTITRSLFEKPGIGNACAAEMRISLWKKSLIPVMAKLIPYYREIGTSDWIKLGEFFIDTREIEADCLSIVAYDCMLKAEYPWDVDQSLEFPMTMEKAANIIAGLMDTTLDPRCSFNASYTIDYPVDKDESTKDDQEANSYSLRDILRYIAVAHAGNWIVTSEGKLLLIPLYGSMPEETNYLVEEHGTPIAFGNVVILV